MPSDNDYKAIAYARDPIKYAHLKKDIDKIIEEEQKQSQKEAANKEKNNNKDIMLF